MCDPLPDKTLQQLDGEDWGEPDFGSYVVVNCHRLRRVPLGEFTVEELRLMVGQSIGLAYLMPLALQRLLADPLAEGNFYPGDLLQAVLRDRTVAFWQEHPDWYATISNILTSLPETPEEIERAVAPFHAAAKFLEERTP